MRRILLASSALALLAAAPAPQTSQTPTGSARRTSPPPTGGACPGLAQAQANLAAITASVTPSGQAPGPITGANAGEWQDGTANGMPYKVLLPAQYDPSVRYPVILYLHQLDMGDAPDALLTEVDPWFNTDQFRNQYRVIVVMPLLQQQADPSGVSVNFGGVGQDGGGQAGALAALQQVMSQYAVDPSRVYVTGNSLGGIGTWDLMIKYNAQTGTQGKTFAAGLPLAGNDYAVTPETAAQTLQGVPIWAVHGAQDTQVPPSFDQKMAQLLSSSASFKYTEMAGQSHDVWDSTYPLPNGQTYWTWLLAQTATAPTGTPTPGTNAPRTTSLGPASTGVAAPGTTSPGTAPSGTAAPAPIPVSCATTAPGAAPQSAGDTPPARPFAPDSLWNIGLGTGAQWIANGQLAGATIFVNTANGSGWNQNIWSSAAADPVVTVTNTMAAGGPAANQNPIIASAVRASSPPAATAAATSSARTASRPPSPAAPSGNSPAVAAVSSIAGTSAGNGPAGQFRAASGRIIDPTGNTFIAHGINIYDDQMGDAAKILSDFPGLNIVRVACHSYDDPSHYQSFIQTMTQHGVITLLEDHTGISAPAYTGSQLQQESAWYAALAAAYKNNPYVWFGSFNEPADDNGSVSAQHAATYQAIRGAGSNTVVLFDLIGGGNPGTMDAGGPLVASDYKSMSNVAWDLHQYDWVSGYSTDVNQIQQTLDNQVHQLQGNFPSADGPMPVIIGEYGDSTNGDSTDAGGSQLVQAVQSDTKISGSIAWGWWPGGSGDQLTDGSGNLSQYGQEVAKWIATDAAPAAAAGVTTPSPAPTATRPPQGTTTPASRTTPPTVVLPNTTAGDLANPNVGALGTFQVHIPAGTTAAPGTDNTFTVADMASGLWCSFGGFQWTGQTTATVSQGSCEPIDGTGIAVDGSNWDEGAGTIRKSDLDQGGIHHMLRVEIPTTLAAPPRSVDQLEPYAWPQTQTDGYALNGNGGPVYSGTIPYGVTIGIPTGMQEPADVAADPGADMLWTALQQHGAMIRDTTTSGGNNMTFQADQNVDGNDPRIQGMIKLGAKIMSSVEILGNQGPDSINGGGTYPYYNGGTPPSVASTAPAPSGLSSDVTPGSAPPTVAATTPPRLGTTGLGTTDPARSTSPVPTTLTSALTPPAPQTTPAPQTRASAAPGDVPGSPPSPTGTAPPPQPAAASSAGGTDLAGRVAAVETDIQKFQADVVALDTLLQQSGTSGLSGTGSLAEAMSPTPAVAPSFRSPGPTAGNGTHRPRHPHAENAE